MTEQATALKIGDRWIYTTPSGRDILHEVVDVDVPPKYQRKPGKCVRLRAIDGSIADMVMWPDDILAAHWMRPADA
jgi:hypothetical protein